MKKSTNLGYSLTEVLIACVIISVQVIWVSRVQHNAFLHLQQQVRATLSGQQFTRVSDRHHDQQRITVSTA